jgi:hypothetical protein
VSTSLALKKLQTFINPDNDLSLTNENAFYSHSQSNLSQHLQEAAIFSMKGEILLYLSFIISAIVCVV